MKIAKPGVRVAAAITRVEKDHVMWKFISPSFKGWVWDINGPLGITTAGYALYKEFPNVNFYPGQVVVFEWRRWPTQPLRYFWQPVITNKELETNR